MNLKEAFRYQNFLETMIGRGCVSIMDRSHSVSTIRHHKVNKVVPEIDDFDDSVVPGEDFFRNDDVIKLLEFLIAEKIKLSSAVSEAKTAAEDKYGIDIDVALAANKCRQRVSDAIKSMLSVKPSTRTEYAYGQKFNVEGNQIDYKYEVDVTTSDAFDRNRSKEIAKSLTEASDTTSTMIDTIKVNTAVDYSPVFDVNDTFDDVMTEFLNM